MQLRELLSADFNMGSSAAMRRRKWWEWPESLTDLFY